MLQDQLDQVRSILNASNASIGRLVVDLFGDESALQAPVAQLIEEAICAPDSV